MDRRSFIESCSVGTASVCAMASLPAVVQQQGVKVSKSTRNYLLIVGLISEDGSMSGDDLRGWVRELERQGIQFRFLATPQIERGELLPGQAVSERELSLNLGVSRMTALAA